MQPYRLVVLALLSIAPPALAADGVLEINQTCAVETGCFAGDGAGFPVSIGAPGSYRLTSNLVVPGNALDGIELLAPSVGIDLGGFEITREACLGATLPCVPNSSIADGIEDKNRSTATPRVSGASIKNGTISGMGGFGVILGRQAEVTNLRVRWNAETGILVQAGSTVVGSTAEGNGVIGISGNASSFIGNVASENGSHGLLAIDSTVTNNTIYKNGGDGIQLSGGVASGNTVVENELSGIFCSRATISGNTAKSNTGAGIRAIASSVLGNTTRQNGGSGIQISGGESRIEANNMAQNLRGIQVPDGGNIILKNTASGNSSGNYDIGAGNSFGPLIGVVGVGDIGSAPGADHPWANFGY